ncbi:MAG: hypothetical protein KKA79_09920, partial [Nanoarchaeota archaeon]|nr:hypothetical protein [Nanoarchaeota archaeon]
MKKGQTESYSFLIGIIITVLILTAIGCATYNAFRPQGKDSFEKLTSLLEKLEKEDIDESGEFPFYVEKDEVLLGFGIGREFIGKEGFWSIFNWECYGITFAWGAGTPFGITGKITRPEDKCPLDKSCLCLCEIVSVVTTYGIKETACQGESVKCAVFDTLDFLGGEGCKPGVFIPGRKGESEDERKPRGLSSIYYTKKGNTVS